MLLSDRFLGFFMVPGQGSWNYNFMVGEVTSVLAHRTAFVVFVVQGRSSRYEHEI
jgi:hypothetical protein